jgi:hypothetical protein
MTGGCDKAPALKRHKEATLVASAPPQPRSRDHQPAATIATRSTLDLPPWSSDLGVPDLAWRILELVVDVAQNPRRGPAYRQRVLELTQLCGNSTVAGRLLGITRQTARTHMLRATTERAAAGDVPGAVRR